MRRLNVLIAVALAILTVSGGMARAQSGEWVKLGELKVQPSLDQDSFALPEAAPGVIMLRLQARGGRVVLNRVQVGWGDGSVHSEDRTINLLDGERTRPIDRQALVRKPMRIGVLYGAREATDRHVTLEAWGFKPRAPDSIASPDAFADGGRRIAAQRIDRGADHIVIPLDQGDTFERVRIHVGGRAVKLTTVTAGYDRGPAQTLTLDTLVPAGAASRWLPVDRTRTLRELTLELGDAAGTAGARVTVFGDGPQATARAPQRQRRAPAERDVPGATRGVAVEAETRAEARRESPVAAPPPPPTAGAGPRPEAVTAARPRAVVAPATIATEPSVAPACIAEATCTPVPVYIGSNRVVSRTPQKVSFTAERGEKLVLGRATVTVPRAYRRKGEISLPGWNNLLRLSLPWTVDPTRHFTILEGATRIYAVPEDFLADVVKSVAEAGAYKDHAFVFVHGFNVSFDNALYRTAQIAFDLGTVDKPFGTAFLFSWPSKGEIGGYLADKDSSRLAVTYLKEFIELVVSRTGVKNVHLVAHSMGNAALLAALTELAGREDMRQRLGQVILASPDVDAREFETIAAGILPLARAITLYASSTDLAMVASRNAYALPRAGDLVNGKPVFIKGLDSIDVSAVSSSFLSLNHSLYADRKELLNDMRSLMVNGTRPPHVRNINLQHLTDETGGYWKYVE